MVSYTLITDQNQCFYEIKKFRFTFYYKRASFSDRFCHLLFFSRLMLQSMYSAGGPLLLAEKWDTDVAECRRNTLSAFKYLLETELVSCTDTPF